MAEEVTHAKAIAIISPQSLLAGELYQLRQRRKRISTKAAVTENDIAQKQCIERLIAMGRKDLTE